MAKVSVVNARSAIMFHLASKLQTASGDDPWATLKQASLSPQPEDIFDLDGDLLFYDFKLVDAGVTVGYARAAADDRLTTPVYFIAALSAAYTVTDRQTAKTELSQVLGVPVSDPLRLVCYSFPKVGYLFEVTLGGQDSQYIYDTAERSIWDVASLPVNSEVGDPLDDIEGVTATSVFKKEVREAGPGSDVRMKSEFENIFSVAAEILPEGAIENDLAFTEDDFERLKDYFENNPPAISSLMLPVELIPQITPVYCAAASAQMILKPFGIDMDQEDIAAAMNIGEHGATNRDQFAAYKTLSNDRLAPSFDNSPTFAEAKAAVDQFIPMKSGVPGHARVVRGWKMFTYISPLTGDILRHEEWVLVNDPYPVGVGAVRWESLSNHNYQNFIYAYRSPEDNNGN
jgi:hypothetical protein